MCGITGFLDLTSKADTSAIIQDMTRRLAHRGPDGEGVLVKDNIALGHRRLAIIDLQTGAQPMQNAGGDCWVSFNGEIYNYRELRDRLSAKGHHFQTQSDTEVLLHGWKEWGINCVDHLRGMFAFVIVDHTARQLFAARDHFGVKPLYYQIAEDRVVCASELQAWRAFEDRPRELDMAAMDAYFACGFIPAPLTIYKNIRKLGPAERLLVNFDGTTSGAERYWALKFEADDGPGEAEWIDQLQQAIEESVSAHLVSDVPFGAFLSGGLDSTAVVGAMSEKMSDPVKTFSIGFPDEKFDESVYARQVSESYKTEHINKQVQPDFIPLLPDLVRHAGEPFGDSSIVPTWYVCQLARQHVPMVLSGDGGDEGLAGYARHGSWQKYLNPSLPQRSLLKKIARQAASMVNPGLVKPDVSRREAHIHDYLTFTGGASEDFRRRMFSKDYTSFAGKPIAPMLQIDAEAASCPRASTGQFYDYRSYLPNGVLAKVDLASMMHGLEVRVPLVDIRMVELFTRIPATLASGFTDENVYEGKRPLKALVARRFGRSFVDRKKMGFVLPLERWFAHDGALRGMLTDTLLSTNASVMDYVEKSAIESLLDEHGREHNHSQILWQLLFLEKWFDYER